MQELQDAVECVVQHRQCALFVGSACSERKFFRFNEPVAEIRPHQIIECVGGGVETELIQLITDSFDSLFKSAEHPLLVA